MFKVVKRDGEVASFNIGKITNAIEKAFKATDKQFNTDIIEFGTRVTADFQNKIKVCVVPQGVEESVKRPFTPRHSQNRLFGAFRC